jgi:flagellar biogenesis protein FliO
MKYVFVLFSLLGVFLFGESQATPAAPNAPASPVTPATPAAPKVVKELTPPPEVQDYGAAFFKMILMLVALLVLVVLTVWIIKRWGFGKMGRLKDKQSIQILEKRVLSPKTALYTIEIEGSRLLVVESQLEVRALHQWQVPSEEI